MAVLEQFFQILCSHAVSIMGLMLLGRLIYNHRKLSHIPGPLFAGCTDLWRFVHCIRQQANTEYKLHQKYNSPLIRLGPNTVSVADPRVIPVIYGLKPIYNKGYLYITHQFMNDKGEIMHNLSSTRDEGIHARLRRAVSSAYAMSNVLDYEPLMDTTTDEFFRILTERFVETGKECPLADWLQYFAFDVLGEITFSKRFGFMEAGEDVEHMLHHTANHMEYLGHMGQLPLIDEYFRLRNVLFRQVVKINAIVTFTARHIAEHSHQGGKPDFVDRFNEAAEKYPDIMTPAQLQDYAVTNVSAGSDTTAIVFRSLIYYLLTDSRVYEIFMEEVKSVVNARPQDDSFNKHISWNEARQMTYTQACLKEALRMHPPLGQILPRVVPPGGITICGQYLKEGTEVGCNAWTVHRDKTVFGEDADRFRPERWIENDTERLKDMERYMFSFGAGSRTCIGRHVAMLELSKVIPEIFRIFKISLVDPKRYTNKAGWLVVQSGLDVRMTKRNPREFIANVRQ